MASKEETESLLKTDDNWSYSGDSASEKRVTDAEDPPPPYEESASQKKANTKRDRLQRNPSLDKVDEDMDKEKKEETFYGCSDYFGVKSYLHHFYDHHFYKDPSIYEDEDDFRYLLHPNPRRRRCTSIWWKVFVWIGANFLVFGIIGVLVGYLVPQRPLIIASVGYKGDKYEVIDNQAISFNFNLDVCKLVGLILFCIGGLTLTVALLFPSFLNQYCDDDRRESAIKVRIADDDSPLSPVEMSIPVSSKISEVQPGRRDEAIATQVGMLEYKD